MTGTLTGKTALITGASRGIGRAIALRLHAMGAVIIAVARPSDDLEALQVECSDRCMVWAGDATKDDLLDYIARLPRLDILVNNAGTNVPKPMTETDDAALDLMLNLNVRAAYRIARTTLSVMPDGGRIINISSQMGHVGSPRRTAYCMTKHALEGLTKAMAIELATRNICVNAIAPTFVETPMTKPMLAEPEFATFVKNMIPLGRVARTEDIAEAAAFLAGPGGNMITGHSLVVDGGWTAQ